MKKIIIGSLIVTTLFSIAAPAVQAAAAEKEVSSQISYEKKESLIATDNILTEDDLSYLNDLGVTKEMATDILNTPDTEITLVNGIAYDKDGNLYTDDTEMNSRGKFTSIVKAIRKSYNKFPNWLKAVLSLNALDKALSVLDTFTGKVEDGLTIGLELVGFSGGVARVYAKLILALV